MRASLTDASFAYMDDMAIGRSGAKYRFDLVVQRASKKSIRQGVTSFFGRATLSR